MSEEDKQPVSRRDFLRRGAARTAKAAADGLSARAGLPAPAWIRPPFAVSESEMATRCTRCNACVEACPYGVIFALPERVGAAAAGTPALDLLRKGCHLCEGWPCVTVCEPRVLILPTPPDDGPDDEPDTAEAGPILPRLATAKIDIQRCLPYQGPECGACADSCPVPDALLWDGPRPTIDPARCTGCALCREVCIVDPKAVVIGLLE